MIVWGGSIGATIAESTNTGGRYDPATRTWRATTTVDAPSPRQGHTAVWTGTEMIIWGGVGGSGELGDGAAYDPETNEWRALSQVSAPTARQWHAAVWTGTEMLMWGGHDGSNQTNTGARYHPVNDQWALMSLTGAPSPRQYHVARWDAANARMIIHGGLGDVLSIPINNDYFPMGGEAGAFAYEPGAGTWKTLPTAGEPSPRGQHSALMIGSDFLVFGGADSSADTDTGFRLSNAGWDALASSGLSARRGAVFVLLEEVQRAVLWGGFNIPDGALDDGAVMNADTRAWVGGTSPNVLEARNGHTAVSTGDTMIVWGGSGGGAVRYANGGVFTP